MPVVRLVQTQSRVRFADGFITQNEDTGIMSTDVTVLGAAGVIGGAIQSPTDRSAPVSARADRQ